MKVADPGLKPGVRTTLLNLKKSQVSRHTAYRLYSHITWHTWRRVGCLNADVLDDVQGAIEEASERCGVNVLRGACLSDHVHLLVSFRPTTRLSDFVGFVKGLSAWRSNKRVYGSVRWSRGFSAQTIAARDIERVDRYICIQHLRHPDAIPRGLTRPSYAIFTPSRTN